MKKLFLILIVCLSLCTTVSCKNQFDRTDTENLYAQIVFSNNKKVNLELYYDKAPITDSKSYAKAQEELKNNESQFFSREELDKILPIRLRKGIKNK